MFRGIDCSEVVHVLLMVSRLKTFLGCRVPRYLDLVERS